MKQLLFTLIFFFSFLSFNYSQVEFGLTSGAQVSNLIYEIESELEPTIQVFVNTQPRIDFFFGIFSKFRLSNKTNLALELDYSRKGFSQDLPLDRTYQYLLSYMELIPEIEFGLTENLFIGAGLSIATLVEKKSKDNEEAYQNLTDGFFKPFNLGIIGKVRYNIGKMYLFSRFNYGLLPIIEFELADTQGEENGNVSYKIWTAQLGVGYSIPYKKK